MRHRKSSGGVLAARIRFIRKIIPGWLFPSILIAMIVVLCIQIDEKLRPAAEKLCTYECENLASTAVSEGVVQTLETLSLMELTLTNTLLDADGTITGIKADTASLNLVQGMLLENVNAALAKRETVEFSVNTGTLTGIAAFNGRGPEIPLRFCLKGNTAVSLHSSFSSAGMNQTLHSVTAEVTIKVGCSVPLYSADTSLSFTYLLCETVIVGDVPSVSWNYPQTQ